MGLLVMFVLALLQAGRGAGGGGFGGGGAPPGGGMEFNPVLQLVGIVVGNLIQGAIWWGAFAKADKPGWAGFIPVYREMIWAEIAEKPSWWGIVCGLGMIFCPILGLILALLLFIEIAPKFGQGTGYAIGMLCCGIIFIPILSYGSAEYQGGRRKRRRPLDEDDEDDDDRPRRRRARDEEEEEEEDRPRRRKPPARDDDDDDEDDRRVRRRPRDDDD